MSARQAKGAGVLRLWAIRDKDGLDERTIRIHKEDSWRRWYAGIVPLEEQIRFKRTNKARAVRVTVRTEE
ncbi:MAG: hypothetical protein JSR30_00195 [Proteobacteria bacterium]|nr:hypothetical protein [Pseudomonadota bacterium]